MRWSLHTLNLTRVWQTEQNISQKCFEVSDYTFHVPGSRLASLYCGLNIICFPHKNISTRMYATNKTINFFFFVDPKRMLSIKSFNCNHELNKTGLFSSKNMFSINLILQSWSYHAKNANHDSSLMTWLSLPVSGLHLLPCAPRSPQSRVSAYLAMECTVHSSSSSSIKCN